MLKIFPALEDSFMTSNGWLIKVLVYTYSEIRQKPKSFLVNIIINFECIILYTVKTARIF